MRLEKELQSFLGWMRTNALPGFMEYTKSTDSDDNKTVSQVLLEIAADIKMAVRVNDADGYLRNADLYKQYFTTINEELARTTYEDLVDEFLDTGLDSLSAKTMAVDELWKNPLFIKYLDVQIDLVSPTTGEIVTLVGCVEHARGVHPYITAEEVAMLKKNFMDPWKYVYNRERSNVEIHNDRTG